LAVLCRPREKASGSFRRWKIVRPVAPAVKEAVAAVAVRAAAEAMAAGVVVVAVTAAVEEAVLAAARLLKTNRRRLSPLRLSPLLMLPRRLLRLPMVPRLMHPPAVRPVKQPSPTLTRHRHRKGLRFLCNPPVFSSC